MMEREAHYTQGKQPTLSTAITRDGRRAWIVLAVCAALAILGLTDQPDTYGLAAAAIKQLNKFS